MMGNIEIKSNRQWRSFLNWQDLTEKEQTEFNWMDEQTQAESFFIRYKNWVYCLQDFLSTDQIPNWHAYHNDSAFSGIVIKVSSDCEQYQIGTYFS